MNEYTVGCIADLISQGNIKTKKKKSITENADDLTPQKSKKKLKPDNSTAEPLHKSVKEYDGNQKKLKNKKLKHNSKVIRLETNSNSSQSDKSSIKLNQIENSLEVVSNEKKKKHKSKSNLLCNDLNESTPNLANTKTNNSGEISKKNKKKKLENIANAVVPKNELNKSITKLNNVKDFNSGKAHNKKSKHKNKSSFTETPKIKNNSFTESNIEIGKQNIVNSSPEFKAKPKKRKKSEGRNENESNCEPLPKPKKQKKDFPGFDHVPTDSEEENENEQEKKEKPSKNENNQYKDFTENTVFIGNIPINYDKHKVHKIFSKFGKIKTARIRCVPIADINMSKKVAAVTKDFNPKRKSLVAYVKYDSKEGANAALEANGMVIDGHHIRVDLAEEKKERDTNKAVFVGGLPFDIEDDELWEFFEKCGKILSVRVIRDSQTSMGKGFGYVNFDSTASVELALQLDGELLKKRTINVKRCVKSRNKNKMNAFGKKKSKEMTNQLLAKRGKKLKAEKKKEKLKVNPLTGDFQGKKANIKEKKKKKPSKSELRKRKIVKILGFSGKEK